MNRRGFIKTATTLSAGAVLSRHASQAVAAPPARRPNVLLILSDDHGTLDLNCYGSRDLRTPHLDALANRGVSFSQFYAPSAVCSPSRAGLLTGCYPQRAGVPTNVGRNALGMSPAQVTIAEMLRDAGYRTALFGKWHLGTTPECSPLAQGFDEFLGHKNGCIDNYSHFFYWGGPHYHDLWRNDEEHWEEGTHFSDLIVREAKRFLEENRSRPFFLYLPFNVPHYPLQPQEQFRRIYEKLEEPRRTYAAFVSMLDAKVGEVLAKVDELGLRENTLVIFLSDQGHSTEERANFGGGNAGPYRGAKGSLFEGGIRVPCIASLPGRMPRAEVRDQFAASLDWLPTIAALCGVELPERPIDGKSLVPVLESLTARTPHEAYHWQLADQWAVREGDWKLVANAHDTQQGSRLQGADATFLSDMRADATESNNLATAHPDIVQRLAQLHEHWLADVITRDQ